MSSSTNVRRQPRQDVDFYQIKNVKAMRASENKRTQYPYRIVIAFFASYRVLAGSVWP